jgi:DNA-binding XRE family transcriptional regulator
MQQRLHTKTPIKFGYDEDKNKRKLRLRALRKYMRMNQVEFSDWVGINYKKWNHYENGYGVPRDAAFIIAMKFQGKLTLDWIWFGRPLGDERLLNDLNRLIEEELSGPRRLDGDFTGLTFKEPAKVGRVDRRRK